MTKLEDRIRSGLQATAERIPESATVAARVGGTGTRSRSGVWIVAAAAVVVLALFGPLLVFSLNRFGPGDTADPSGPTGDVVPGGDGLLFANPEHIRLQFDQDLTLMCQGADIIDNGGFDSFTVDIWIDNQAGFTRLGITYPDGSTYDLIFEGQPRAYEQAWGRGTDLGRNAGCRGWLDGGGYSQSVAGWGFQDLSEIWFTAYLIPVTTDVSGATVNVEGQPTRATSTGPGTYLDDQQFADGATARREFSLDEDGIRVIGEHRHIDVPNQFEATASIEVVESGPSPMPSDIFDTSTFTPLWGNNIAVTTTQAPTP